MAAEPLPLAGVHQHVDTLFQAGALGGWTDGELLERFVTRRDATAGAAFAALVERHGPMVLRVCRRVLHDQHDAEDAAQAAFLVLARRARKIRRRDSVASWLFGVAVRVAREAKARRDRRRRFERLEAGMEAHAIASSIAEGTEPAIEPPWAELYQELERLPDSLRAPLVLCYLEGLTNEQAATKLGTSLRTLRRRLAEGRERLKARLKRLGVAPSASIVTSALDTEPLRSAPMPTAWADQTVRAALEFAATGSAAGAASGALALAREFLRAMFRAKLRLSLLTALLVGSAVLAGLTPLALNPKTTQAEPNPLPPQARAPAPVENPPPDAGQTPLPDFITARPRTGPGRTTQIRIVDAQTGAPIPNAHVRLWKAFLDFWLTTDAQGRIAIEHSTGPADTSFVVDAWGDGFAMQRQGYGERDEPIPDEVTIRLQPGTTLGGRVVDEQNRPVAGAKVYLWSHNYKRKDPGEMMFDLRATTGLDGRWQTRGAPETTGELIGIYITHPDYISDRQYVAGREEPPIEALRAGEAVSVLKKGPLIEGRVLDADGQPVAGAFVVSTTNPRQMLFSDLKDFAVVTDADGRFRTGQVQPGAWYLAARAPGHGPGLAAVKVANAIPQVEIRLTRPRTLKVRVQDPQGRPIEGAFVYLDSWRTFRGLGVFFWTDAEGRARWDDASDEQLILDVSEKGYLGLTHQYVHPSDKEIVFTLKPAISILGVARDAGTNERIEQADIEYGALDPETGEVTEWVRKPRDGFGGTIYKGDITATIAIEADAFKLRFVAEGYQPFVTRTFRPEERVVYDYDVKLQPLEEVKPQPDAPSNRNAVVLLPDGKPLADARVVVTTATLRNISLLNGQVREQQEPGRELRTGPDGSFPIPPLDPRSVVFVTGEGGYGYATSQALEQSPKIQAQPFARVEGRYLIGDRPGANLPITLSGHIQGSETNLSNIFSTHETTTDAEGRFTFERVISIPDLRVARRERTDTPGHVWATGEVVHVAPGETAHITYGGTGRPVVGRVAPPEGWTEPVDFSFQSTAYILTNRAMTPYPLELFRGKTTLQGGDWGKWMLEWRETPEGLDYRAKQRRFMVALAPDGSFRVDDVPPDEYRLIVHVGEEEGFPPSGRFATFSRTFTVPPVPEGERAEPVDFGLLRLRRRTTLDTGQPAPEVEVTTVEDQHIAVPGDYRDRYLLLDFGTTHNDQSRLQIARVNGLHEKFGAEERFAIVSLIIALDNAETRQFVAEKGQPWPQAIVGSFPNAIVQTFGVEDSSVGVGRSSPPLLVLIGPDGKVLAKDVYGREMEKVLDDALGK